MELEEMLFRAATYAPYAVGLGLFASGFILGRLSKSSKINPSPYTLDGKDKVNEGLEDYVASSVPSALSGKSETGSRISCKVYEIAYIGEGLFVGVAEDEHGRAPFYADTNELDVEDTSKLWTALKDAERKNATIHMRVQPDEAREILVVERVTHTIGKIPYDITVS